MSYIRCTTKLIARSFHLRNLGDLAFLIGSLVILLNLGWAGLTGNWWGFACVLVIWLAMASLLAEYHAALIADETASIIEQEREQ